MQEHNFGNVNRLIPFQDILTILVSIFVLLRDVRKGRVRVGEEGGF